MRAAFLVALTCCLVALVRSQDIDVSALLQEQLNGPAVQNILSKIPEANQCRSNSDAFIRSCTQDLIETTSLKTDTATLVGMVNIDNAANTLAIQGTTLAGFVDGATASDACCRASCAVAQQGCMCNAGAWNEMVRLFSGAAGVNGVFSKIVAKCNTGGRSFQAVMDPGSSTCSADFIPTAKAFTC
ncbi:hypothetical protein BSKO_05755 [Bryopsis sp. KO-2023]|nr:hypothetical protein BSKO_05755 [Bryopsis sp. KO-2023]